jgi:hypothetical protein
VLFFDFKRYLSFFAVFKSKFREVSSFGNIFKVLRHMTKKNPNE